MAMNAGIVDFAVYENGKEYLGIAKFTPPSISNKTFTLSGAGLGGDVDIPSYKKEAMRATLNFTDTSDAFYKLSESRAHLLDLRAVHQNFDPKKGDVGVTSHKYIMEFCPINSNSGDIEPSSPQGTSVEGSVISLKEYYNGKLVRHVDPVRYIDKDSSGKNRLDAVKNALGK
ncbi:MAG: phage major tail tube protein [Acutalibacteraceae bacterium]